MKTLDTNLQTRSIGMNVLVYGMLLFLAAVFFTSCERGRDGRDGRAFLALNWESSEPDYVDAGTSDIPATFEWGKYYNTWPGSYNFYYDGKMMTSHGLADYAWEIDYEIYNLRGESGYYYMDGEDAPDTYFSIICTPYGPEFYDEGSIYKSSPPDVPVAFTIQKKVGGMGIKINAHPVAKRTKK